MDRDLFTHYVQEALEHVFDPSFLHSHPLAALLAPGRVQGLAGEALQSTLREAIEALKPPSDVPRHSPAWRLYLCLRHRHLDLLTTPQVADQLGIGERQCRRDHHKAVSMVASLLWAKYQGGPSDGSSPRPTDGRGSAAPSDDSDALLEAEVAKLGQVATDPTSLGEVIDSIISTISPLVERKAIHLTAAVPPDLPDVAMSRTALRQALLSTLLSLIEWSRGCQVSLVAYPEGDWVGLEVLVRRPLVGSQLESDEAGWRSRLGVCFRLVQLQGGEVVVSVREATVQLRLRLPIGQRLKVLVVDDNPDSLGLFRRYLAGGAYEVVEASNGADALRLAAASAPDAVVLDIMMPSLDGWEALQALKSDPATSSIPVIVCSVLRETELAIALGASGCLAKPISQEDLVRALWRLRSPGARPGQALL